MGFAETLPTSVFLTVRILLLTLCLCFSLSAAHAGADTTGYAGAQWSANLHRGFLIPHRPNVLHLIQGHTVGAELNVEWFANPAHQWSKAYAQPSVGFDAYFSTTGNAEALGHHWSLHGFARLPLGHSKIRQTLKVALGAGWATRIWDLEANLGNVMLGSHLNTALALQYRAEFNLTEKLQVTTGFRLEHFSNGAFQLPNLGSNIGSVFIGFAPRPPSPMVHATTLSDHHAPTPYVEHSLSLSAGIKEVGDPQGKKYGVYVLSATTAYRWTYKSSVIGGADLFYNRSMPEALKEPEAGLNKQWLLGATVGYGLHFNAIDMRILMGVYLRDPYKGYGSFYHRVGMRYWLSPRCYMKFTLRTHFARADSGELGVGLRLNKPKVSSTHHSFAH